MKYEYTKRFKYRVDLYCISVFFFLQQHTVSLQIEIANLKIEKFG